MSQKPLVLVTGGSGFLAQWVIVYLFREGYRVRTTVRNTSRTPEIHVALKNAKIPEEQINSLEVVQADLLKDDGWADAVKDVEFVQHVASPFPPGLPKHEDDLILPAREGTLRVLRFARDSGAVKRVVVTSSFAAIGYGHSERDHPSSIPFKETDWSNLTPQGGKPVAAYPKSKTLAERAAWDFMEKEAVGKFELAVVNPVGIFGPCLGKDAGTSLRAVSELLEGSVPGCPRLQLLAVDVRDCADMHIRVMENPKAAGERFNCVGEGGIWMADMAKLLKKNLGDKSRKVPTMQLPDFAVRVVAMFVPVARLVVNDLGQEKQVSNQKAKDVLGWQWKYGTEQTFLASAESLIAYGAVKI